MDTVLSPWQWGSITECSLFDEAPHFPLQDSHGDPCPSRNLQLYGQVGNLSETQPLGALVMAAVQL